MAKPDPKDIESLVELFNQSDWDEMHLKTDELEIFLSNDPKPVGPSQTPAPAPNLVVPPGEEAPPTAPAPTPRPPRGQKISLQTT